MIANFSSPDNHLCWLLLHWLSTVVKVPSVLAKVDSISRSRLGYVRNAYRSVLHALDICSASLNFQF